MFDRFTNRARKIIGLARQEAQRLNHEYVSTEHLLLGLIIEGQGTGYSALRNLDINFDSIAKAIESIVQSGPPMITNGGSAFTPRAKKSLELAVEEASQLGVNYVGTEHLLLGLIRENEGVAAVVLKTMNLDYATIREEITEMLGISELKEPSMSDPVVTLIKRRVKLLSEPSEIEKKYGSAFCGPRLAALKELEDLLVDVERLRV